MNIILLFSNVFGLIKVLISLISVLLRKIERKKEMEASEEVLKIRIPDYQISDPASSKRLVLYRVETTNKQDEISSVLRSYQDFLKIRKLLIYRWPGIYIPFISSKVKQVLKNKRVPVNRKMKILSR